MVNFFSHHYNKMENKIMCDCGVSVNKRNLSKHKKSKEHLKKLKQMEAPRETSPYIEEDIEDKSEADEEQSEASAKEVIEDTKPEEEDYEEREEEIVEVKPNKKAGQSKEYMDAIRKKAIMTIKQKKQAKIDQENLIRQKAEQYDVLVKSLKEKEELEKKKKEEEKLKDMEYKAQQYEKMLKQQQRNQVINNMAQGKIIDDIKEKRLEYLMRYLSNPTNF
jgi:hypothetical protein